MFSEEAPIISFEEAQKIQLEIEAKQNERKHSKRPTKGNRFTAPNSKFSPADYTLEDWMKLGLSKKQSSIVMKFSARGISSEEELKKIFVIPDQLYSLIKDSIIYTSKQVAKTDPKSKVKEKLVVVDINTGSESELQTIPGIGPFFAAKIVEYRNQLGGFNSISQLLEIWKFDQEKLDNIAPFIVLSENLKKINIQSATVEDLKAHPYISYQIANSIVKMRAHEKFRTVEDIQKSKLIDNELFQKIKPYLECK